MAFKASNVIPSDQYDRAKKLAVQLKRLAENRSASYASGATSAEVLALADNLGTLRTLLNDIKSTPGIAAYAKDQEDDQTYDVAAEFNAMIAAADAAITELVSALPKDGSGWLLINKINADGTLSPRSFTGAALSTLRTKLDDIAATVV